jgi:hypothetical protein
MEKYEVEISCSIEPGVYWPSGLVARLRSESHKGGCQVSSSDLIATHLASALGDIHGVVDITVAAGKLEDFQRDGTHQEQLPGMVTETHQSEEEQV